MFPSVIGLSVGGKIFATRLSTLIKYPDSMLGAMFSGRHNLDTDRDGNYFIDRNGKYFEHILDFLRNHQYLPPKDLTEAVLDEAEYYGLNSFVEILKKTPALFPEHCLRDERRKAIVNYGYLKEKVTAIAMKGVLSTNYIHSTNTEVCILYYSSTNADMCDTKPNIIAISFQEVLTSLLAGRCLESSINLSMEDAKDCTDFIGFYNVLLYDLRKAGYEIKANEEYFGHPPPRPRNKLGILYDTDRSVSVEFNGKILRCIARNTLTFIWPSKQNSSN